MFTIVFRFGGDAGAVVDGVDCGGTGREDDSGFDVVFFSGSFGRWDGFRATVLDRSGLDRSGCFKNRSSFFDPPRLDVFNPSKGSGADFPVISWAGSGFSAFLAAFSARA